MDRKYPILRVTPKFEKSTIYSRKEYLHFGLSSPVSQRNSIGLEITPKYFGIYKCRRKASNTEIE